MPANKDRLYVALHVRGGRVKMPSGEDKYHWSLLLAPKSETPASPATILHAKETITAGGASTWVFEERSAPLGGVHGVLARVCVAKVPHRECALRTLRAVPLREAEDGWNCVGWVREALATLLEGKALGRNAVGDWDRVRDACMGYVERKKAAHRYDGQGGYDMGSIPTWDMLRNRETVP